MSTRAIHKAHSLTTLNQKVCNVYFVDFCPYSTPSQAATETYFIQRFSKVRILYKRTVDLGLPASHLPCRLRAVFKNLV